MKKGGGGQYDKIKQGRMCKWLKQGIEAKMECWTIMASFALCNILLARAKKKKKSLSRPYQKQISTKPFETCFVSLSVP